MANPDCTYKDKEYHTEKVEEINQQIQDIHEKDLLDKENAAIKKIKTDPRHFYAYVNKNRKSKSKEEVLHDENPQLL